MSTSSQYYRVTARVGVPHRYEVDVTVPLVGPAGATGATGASTWNEISGKPATFPPSAHEHQPDEVYADAAFVSQSGDSSLQIGIYLHNGTDNGRPVYESPTTGDYIWWDSNLDQWYLTSNTDVNLYYLDENADEFPWETDVVWNAIPPQTGNIEVDQAFLSDISDYGVASVIGLKTSKSGNASSTELVLGSDTRLTNSRTPSSTLAHAASHHTGGSDALAPANIGAAAAVHTHTTADITGLGTAATEDFAAPPAIGSTTPNTGAFTTLSANNGTLTASAPVLDLAQTWNDAAVTFTGLKVDATDTASATNSLLLQLQTGGTDRFSVNKAGRVSALSLGRDYNSQWIIFNTPFGSATQMGGVWFMQNNIAFGVNASLGGNSGALQLGSGQNMGWSSATNPHTANADLRLFRDAADTLAQHRATNPQTFRIYNTYTTTSSTSTASPPSSRQATIPLAPLTAAAASPWSFCLPPQTANSPQATTCSACPARFIPRSTKCRNWPQRLRPSSPRFLQRRHGSSRKFRLRDAGPPLPGGSRIFQRNRQCVFLSRTAFDTPAEVYGLHRFQSSKRNRLMLACWPCYPPLASSSTPSNSARLQR
jgi:hypothetical protein